ncbi:MAG TPA: L,D-transpeptidase, partial [Actinomycetota bacterium]
RTNNRLTLYDDLKAIRSYPVATAREGFETPPGQWSVVDKQVDPTWHNPAPNGWGAGEPLVIGPGPDDPLGTRALALSAPGILIHGTPDDPSVGTYASHGCIRMHIPDSEALFPLVPVGTPVFIVGSPPWGNTPNPGPAG